VTALVDCQVHPLVPDIEPLLERMDANWVDRFRGTAFALPGGIPHPGRPPIAPPRPPIGSPGELAAALAPTTECAILVPTQSFPSPGWCDVSMNNVLAAALNDEITDVWVGSDPRFRLAAVVSAQDPGAAADEIARQTANPSVVAIATSLVDVNLGGGHYEPIFAALAAAGLPLIVHPGGTEGFAIGAPRLGGIGPKGALERFTLLPQVAQANIASVIYGGVFLRYPELKIVFAGFGFDWAQSLLWRADAEWRNLRIDVPWLTESPGEFFARNVRLVLDGNSAAPREQQLAIVRTLPAASLLYGSDLPFAAVDPEATLACVPEETRAAAAAQNAYETFGERLRARQPTLG
jgi:predicted TIM-barrel fold metal-dependent hydrolase